MRLLGAGAILLEVIAAAQLLAQDFGVNAQVWSVTSFVELSREAREVQRHNRLMPGTAARTSHVQDCLNGTLPVVAATDYVRALPQLIGEYLDAPYTTLGTDGFGRSDTRKALRRFFEVDRFHIAVAALDALVRSGSFDAEVIRRAIKQYGLSADDTPPWLA